MPGGIINRAGGFEMRSGRRELSKYEKGLSRSPVSHQKNVRVWPVLRNRQQLLCLLAGRWILSAHKGNGVQSMENSEQLRSFT
jgi:hypothetical protein